VFELKELGYEFQVQDPSVDVVAWELARVVDFCLVSDFPVQNDRVGIDQETSG